MCSAKKAVFKKVKSIKRILYGGNKMAGAKNLSLTNLMSHIYEPKRQNRWVLSITISDAVKNLASGGDADLNTMGEELAFAAHTASRPQITYDQTELHRQNERFYVAGKPTWNEIEMEFYDYITGDKSAASILWNWANAIYNPLTGAMGYKYAYSTTATLSLLGPDGEVVESWGLFYLWPANVNWNSLSSESSDVMNVSVTFRYDYAVMASEKNGPDYAKETTPETP